MIRPVLGASTGRVTVKSLRRPWQFRQVYREGTKLICDHAVVFYHRPQGQGDGPRIGFVASKRVGNAVKRNRAKRLLREAMKHTRGQLRNENMWIILVARGSILGAGFHDILNDLQTRLRDEGLLIISDT